MDRCYCFPTANHYPDGCRRLPGGGSRDSARASLYSNSSCCHCQQNWDAGRSTASLHHCFMIASFRERLSSKVAAHWHHGRAPAASWFQLDASESISSWIQLCLDCRDVSGMLLWPKNTSFPVKKQQQRTTTLASSIQKFKNAIPKMGLGGVYGEYTTQD